MKLLAQMLGITAKIREETISTFPIEDIERYVTSFNSLIIDKAQAQLWLDNDVVWATALFECSWQAESSYYMAAHGFYEEASAQLRMILEQFLTRLYWHIKNRKGQTKEWRQGRRLTNDVAEWATGLTPKFPLMREVWKEIVQQPGFAAYDQKYNFKAEIEDTLARLNKYVHGRPESRYIEGAARSSTLSLWFNKNFMDEWYRDLRAVATTVLILSFLEYPELLTTNTATQFASLEPRLASQVQDILQITT